jgi:D-serine deaminase-like pyridoxal phosphate-dependent protein
MNWYTIKDVENIDSPALVVYKDRVEHNIRKVLSMVKDPAQLRPHVKTNKMLRGLQNDAELRDQEV